MNDDHARNRFFAIQLVRLVGVAMVLAGLAVTQGALDLPQWAGVLLLVFGLFDVFFMPRVLAKRWKSPDA
jgi:hypothetical protein